MGDEIRVFFGPMTKNVTIFSLNEKQKWPVWQFIVLWLLPWFFCSCLFVLMFYSGDKRCLGMKAHYSEERKLKEDERKDRGEWAGLVEKNPPDCGRFGKKQPISPVTLTAPHFIMLVMLWGVCCDRISAVEVAGPKHSCVYHCQVPTRRSRK